MITITLTDGTVHKFNLKNFEREFSMRTTWYAMSDTPKYSQKQIKVTTDRGEEILLKVGEIASCAVEDRTYAYDEPVPQPKKEKNPEQTGVEEMRRFFSPDNPELKSLMEEAIGSLGNGTQKKAFLFLEGLRQHNIPVDLNDTRLHMMLLKTIQDTLENVDKHVEEYVQYKQGGSI